MALLLPLTLLLPLLATVCHGDEIIRRFLPDPPIDVAELAEVVDDPGGEPELESRIINGVDASACEFPYQALIQLVTSRGSAICGGSLIAPRYVLTAGHCVTGGGSMVVKLGCNVIYKGAPPPGAAPCDEMKIDRSKIRLHSNYSDSNITNDLAIIELPRNPASTECIKPVRLPRKSMACVDSYEGAEALITGWGQTTDASKKPSTILQVASVTIMKQEKCVSMYKRLQYDINRNQVCSGFLGSGTCSGDSGGPLVIRESEDTDMLTLFGCVSFGTTLCNSGYPSVYTKVAQYLPWITSVTGIPLRQ